MRGVPGECHSSCPGQAATSASTTPSPAITSTGVRPANSAGRSPVSRWVSRPPAQLTSEPSSAMCPSTAKTRPASCSWAWVRPETRTSGTPARCSSSSAVQGCAVSSPVAVCTKDPRGPTIVPSRSV
ncbi:hypothetical protein ACFQX8_17115 [Klenkia terrae]|uniref:hypothetical protein n=1 Tax=Klenkia terrae TaxID=1052259 RepID=UPI0036102E5F